MGHRDAVALPAWRSSVTPFHLDGRCGLVQEHDPVRIKVELRPDPRLAHLGHVRAVLLGRVKRPSFD